MLAQTLRTHWPGLHIHTFLRLLVDEQLGYQQEPGFQTTSTSSLLTPLHFTPSTPTVNLQYPLDDRRRRSETVLKTKLTWTLAYQG